MYGCSAIIVPEDFIDEVEKAISDKLSKTVIGDPSNKELEWVL